MLTVNIGNTNSTNNLSVFSKTAQHLEAQVREMLTYEQLNEILKQSTECYYILTNSLLDLQGQEHQQATELCKQFSQIETQALLKYYKGSYIGRKSLLL
jgi:hypothetical protein